MRFLPAAFFAVALSAFAQVDVGDLRFECTGGGDEFPYDVKLVKVGSQITMNGLPMTVGPDGLYREPYSQQPILIQAYEDGSGWIKVFSANNDREKRTLKAWLRCYGTVRKSSVRNSR